MEKDMRVETNINNTRPSFGVKVSDRLINSVRGYVNSGSNRIKKNYLLNTQLENYGNFGHDDYTIELLQKTMGWDVEYSLVATRATNSKEKIVLAKRNTYKQIIEIFLNLKKHEFNKKFPKRS